MALSHFELYAARRARDRTHSDKFPAGIVKSKYVPVAKVTEKCIKKSSSDSEDSHCSPVNFWQSVVVLGAEVRTNTQIRGARLRRRAKGGGKDRVAGIKRLRKEKALDGGTTVSRRFTSVCEVAVRMS